MIIEDPDAFKAWLTAVLKPICEADPSALAKYVIALVKKDKTPEVLRHSMIEQLQVFLQEETEPFVNLLFKTLESQDYIMPVIPNANPPNPVLIKGEVSPARAKLELVHKEMKPIIPVSELPNLNETINGSAVRKDKDEKKELKKPELEKEEKPRRRSHRSLSRNRSRSRSWDRARRSRSREKSREREQHPRGGGGAGGGVGGGGGEKRDRIRTWRNKSPPRRYERRRSRSGTPTRPRSRSRSPRHPYRGRYRNRSPPRSDSRSRSRSGERKERRDSKGDAKDSHSGAATPTQDSNHGDMDLRLTNTTQSIQSVVQQQGEARNSKRRCRDYDEKGYCMRGEMCPFDHGMDPVVLEDTALTRVLTYAPNGAPDVNPPMLNPPIIGPIMHPMNSRPIPPEYNPQAPQMWHRAGFRGPRPMMGPRLPPMGPFNPQMNAMQRELISVPVMDNQQRQGHDFNSNSNSNHNFRSQPHGPFLGAGEHDDSGPGFKKKGFDFGRLGPRKNPANCSLELKKVPPGLNNITHLNNHFAKFGQIVNIQVFFENDPEAALITFSSHAEANAAYRSTEAVLNNRFIKVFWHSQMDGKQENVPPRSVKERLGLPAPVAPNANKVLNLVQPKAENAGTDADGEGKPTKPEVRKEDMKAQAAAAIKKGQELLAAKEKLKKNQEEKRKEALKITHDLRKRKQELLEKQLAQQKLLIEKLEKTPSGPQRDLLKQTIKKSQEAIEAIRKDMVAQTAVPLKGTQRKSKEETQKEMLDAELDLITKQQEGADTSEIKKKLQELRAKATLYKGRGRGRRFNPIASRHLLTKNNLIDGTKGIVKSVNKSFQKHAVDHRPTRLLVSGYEGDEQESIIAHFGQFGEVVDYITDDTLPSIILNYKTRKEAELALLKGKNFQDRTLTITWCNTSQLNNQLVRSSSRTVLVSESDEDQVLQSSLLEGDDDLGPDVSEEVLLQDDEEEDEENEDRSWRR